MFHHALRRCEVCWVGALFLAVSLSVAKTAMAGIDDGLLAHYPFDAEAVDISGNGLHGVVSGATPTEDRFGHPARAFYFDGVDDSVEVVNRNGIFDLVNAWTLAAWVRPYGAGVADMNDPIIWKLAREQTNEDTFKLGWGWEGGNGFATGLERASDGEDFMLGSLTHHELAWQHVTATYDGEHIRIFVDGSMEAERTIGPVEAYAGPGSLRIGNILNRTANGPYRGVFHGVIDDVRIYDRALLPTEVESIHAIPEPATLVLLALAGPVLLAKRRN